MTKKKLIGELFIESGLITELTLQRALSRSKRLNKRLGHTLEEIELITAEELAYALANQYGCKVIKDFARYTFAREILDIIPVEVAMQHLLFPLKKEGAKLAIAVADPADSKIVGNLAANHGLTVYPFVATRKDIIVAIARHYLGKEPTVPQEKTVLVVEDNKLVQKMLADILGRQGYRVLVENDGMEGYKAALATPPHVVITDKEVPKLNGYALLDALQNIPETRNIPVILLTGSSDAEEEARAFDKGFFDFIPKPVKEVTLVTRVKRAFQSIEKEIALI